MGFGVINKDGTIKKGITAGRGIMPQERHNVAVPDVKWKEIQRILKILPFLANTPSAFVLRAVDNEINRVWEKFRVPDPGILPDEDTPVFGPHGRAKDEPKPD